MQDYANFCFFRQIHFFCSFENLMVKYTFCDTIKIHVFVKSAFIHNSTRNVEIPQKPGFLTVA